MKEGRVRKRETAIATPIGRTIFLGCSSRERERIDTTTRGSYLAKPLKATQKGKSIAKKRKSRKRQEEKETDSYNSMAI